MQALKVTVEQDYYGMYERLKSDQTYIQSLIGREKILWRIAIGDDISECASACGINPAALMLARSQDLELDQAIRKIQGFYADQQIDRLFNIQDEEENPLMARVISDNLKWLATKRMRDVYGDRQDVVVTHKVDISEALEQAKTRTIEFISAKSLNSQASSTDYRSVEQEPTIIDAVEIIEEDPLS